MSNADVSSLNVAYVVCSESDMLTVDVLCVGCTHRKGMVSTSGFSLFEVKTRTSGRAGVRLGGGDTRYKLPTSGVV